jgi:hypothetical protein
MKYLTAISSMLIVPAICSMTLACPMCRDSTVTNAAGGAGGGGTPVALFNASIVCMLGAFLMIIAFLTVRIVAAIRLIDAPRNTAVSDVPATPT